MNVKRKVTSILLLVTLLLLVFSTLRTTFACTIFTVSSGDKVFFGNNEDWYNPNTYIWFELPKEGRYGGVFLGFDNFFPQGGMNEKGLCFDANALPQISLNNHPERPNPQGWIGKYLIDTCENVSRVIQVAQEYNWGTSLSYQVHFADSLGDAVVISAGSDGEINFTHKNTGFIVSTNFNVGYPRNGWIPCWRYPLATEMLQNITLNDNLTVEAVRDILSATHQEGTYATKYSNIFDLVNRNIYVYHNFNFSNVVMLNLDEELAKEEEQYIPISDLFHQDTTSDTEDTEITILFSQTTSRASVPEKTEAPLLLVFPLLIAIILIRKKN